MFARGGAGCVARAVASVIVATIATACWAADPAPNLAVVPANLDAVEGAARQIRLSGCTTSQCQAMVSIADVLRIDLDASAGTAGKSKPIPATRDAVARKSLQNALFDHPERFDAVCDGATRLMAQYSLPGSDSEVFVPVNLILLGLYMDQKSASHCVSRLIAALPDTNAADKAVDNAKRLCIGRHALALCNDIKRS
jgi:hypothetical protein